jgi:flagellar biosynthesis GTPase FlhF
MQINIEALIVAIFLISLSYYISKLAKNLVPRFIFVAIGIGLIIPHILPIITKVFNIELHTLNPLEYIKDKIYQRKMEKERQYKKAQYEKQRQEEEKRAKEEAQRQQEYEKQKREYHKQQQQKQREYEENQRKKYQQNNHEEQKQYKEENHYKEQTKEDTYNDDYNENIPNELKRFYLKDPFSVLGVSRDDDCKTIKKAYRDITKQYHPDLHQDNKLYTQIFQHINNANDRVKKIKGC